MPTRYSSNRSAYMSGSPYPTGMAPLTLDLEKNIAAVTQQMIENRQKEIKENKLQISESENAILTALDFKTLEGGGDQFALQQSERLKNLTDKWSKRWKDGGGILNTKDKLELLKDKRDVEAQLAIGAAEIAQFKEVQEILRKPDQQVYEFEPTTKGMTEYFNKGLLGTGGFINIPVLRKQAVGAAFEARYDPLMKQALNEFKEDASIVDPKTGETRIERSNIEGLNRRVAFLRTQPDYLADPISSEIAIQRMYNKYGQTPSKAGFMARSGGGGSGSATKSAKTQAIANFNSTVLGLANLDQDEMNRFTSTSENVAGIGYSENKNKLIIKYNGNKADQEIDIPKEIVDSTTWQLTKEGELFYQKVWEAYPPSLKQGITTVPFNELKKPELAKQKTYRKPISIEQEEKRAAITEAVDDFKKTIDDYDEGLITGDEIVEAINSLIPNTNTKFKKPWFRSNKIEFDGKKYAISDPAERERLKTDVLSKLNGETGTVVKLNDPTKIFTGAGGITLTAQELVDQYITAGMSETDAINKVNNK